MGFQNKLAQMFTIMRQEHHKNKTLLAVFFSSPENKVLEVSFCDTELSIVSASVRRQLFIQTNFFSKTSSSNLMKLVRNVPLVTHFNSVLIYP